MPFFRPAGSSTAKLAVKENLFGPRDRQNVRPIISHVYLEWSSLFPNVFDGLCPRWIRELNQTDLCFTWLVSFKKPKPWNETERLPSGPKVAARHFALLENTFFQVPSSSRGFEFSTENMIRIMFVKRPTLIIKPPNDQT